MDTTHGSKALAEQRSKLVSSSALVSDSPPPKGNCSDGSSSVAVVNLNTVRYYYSDICSDLDPHGEYIIPH